MNSFKLPLPPEAQKEMDERVARINQKYIDKKLAQIKANEAKYKRKKKRNPFKKMRIPKSIEKLPEYQVRNILKELVKRLETLDQEEYFEGESWREVLGVEPEVKQAA